MSNANHEIGWIAGSTFPLPGAANAAPASGEALWSDIPYIRKGGNWRPGELRTVTHPMGKVMVMGECLATENELHAAAARAIESGDASAMTTMAGSYTGVVINKDGTHFVGDAASQHPLYIRPEQNGTVSFATRTKPFRSGPNAAPPDRLSLALGVGMPWVHELAAGRSVVEGVMTTLPQQSIYVDNAGRITTTRHDSMVAPRPLRLDEAAERLREALLVGAARRAESGQVLSTDFSGGFDSTSAAYVMTSILDAPLTVVTQHSRDTPLDDMKCVKEYLALSASKGKFRPHIYEISAADSMYKDIMVVPPGDVPDVSIRDRANDLQYFKFLRSLGSELHLNGGGADDVLDMPAHEYLGHYARLRTLPYFARSVLQVARTNKDSAWNVLAAIKRADRRDPQSRLLTLAQILTTPGIYDSNVMDDVFGVGTAPNWLRPAMRKEVAEYAAERAKSVSVPDGMEAADYYAYNALVAMGPAQHGINQTAAGAGIRSSTMYLDNDVLKACFGLPAHNRMDPWKFKKLMGLALGGIVPPEVTSRTTKGNYTGHGYRGLRGSQNELRALIKNSRLADLGIINPHKVSAALEKGFRGADIPRASLIGVFASEVWLRSLDNECWGKAPYVAPAPLPVAISQEAKKPLAPLDDQAKYGTPPDVIVACRSNGATVLNIATDQHLRLTKHPLALLRALQTSESLAAAYDSLAAVYPAMESAALRQAAEQSMRDLLASGIVVAGASTVAMLESSLDDGDVLPLQMVYQADATPRVRLLDYGAAVGGFIVGRVVARNRTFADQARILNNIRSRLARRPATPDEATRLLAATRRITRFTMERTACLELSRVAVLGSALRGRYANLVLGMRLDPESLHAWPETIDGVPIRTDADEQINGVYQRLIRL